MQVRVIHNPAFRTARDNVDYFSAFAEQKKGTAEFTKFFMAPMRDNLGKSLRRLVEHGADSFLEVGPGWGSGSDIAIRQGLRNVSMVELNPELVSMLESKYLSAPGDSSIAIYEGDARDVLPSLQPKSTDVGLIFDNTLSNMQEPTTATGLARNDSRPLVLSELVRISRLSVLIGLASVELTPVYLELFAGTLRETSEDGKISIFKNGTVTQRYDDADIAALLSASGVANATVCRDRGIYWIEIKP